MQGLLVFGRSGQVARELAEIAPDARYLGREDADLSDAGSCAAAIRAAAPRVVINAAAYTAVDRAESEAALAGAVNTAAPAAMAQAAADLGIPFLHISTDYVFDGSGTQPRSEESATNPLGVYGATKLQGEQAVLAAKGQAAILRTSWVFSAEGSNFVKSMLRLGYERDELSIVADQIGGPTPAAAIAAALLNMAQVMLDDPAKAGLYHFSGAPDVSWAGFAREIFAQAGISCKIHEIATVDYPTPARRPANSRLDCSKIARDFNVERPDWRTGLADVLAKLEKDT